MANRGSILLRKPAKYASGKNATTADAEYEREQAKLEARRQAQQSRHGVILSTINSDPGHKQVLRRDQKAEMDSHLEMRAKIQEEERQRGEEEVKGMMDSAAAMAFKERQRELERRRERQEVGTQNLLVHQQRERQEALAKSRENFQDKRNFEQDFHNRFGTSLR